MLRSAAALASVLLAAGVGAAEPPEATLRGAALFRGEGLRAALPAMDGLRLEGPAAACARCHGEDARGLLEGGVAAPPLPWRLLRTPTPARPGYDAALLRRALAEGLDAGGRPLHPAMPRYALGDAETAALIAFLADPAGPVAPGVTDAEARIAVPHLPGEEFVPALLDALWSEPGRRAWGRRLRAVPVPVGGADRRAIDAMFRNIAVLAATAGPGVRADGLDAALAARGLPHLFPLDTYDAARANAVLAEAPIAAQLAVLKSRAEALGGPVALLCGAAAASGEDGCVEQAPAGAAAVVFARPARSEDIASIPAGATAFAPLDHAAVLLSRSGTLAFPLVLSDPRGRGMPGPVFEELRRLAPGLLARRPEVARRIHAAGALTAAALQRAGLRPTPSRVRAAAAGIAPGEAGALLAPLHDGVREDGAYGVQLLRVEPGAAAVRTDAAWARP
jgi:hypothetical protein